MKRHYYAICYTEKSEKSSPATRKIVSLPSVKSLAKHLNRMKLRNPDSRILATYVCDSEGKWLAQVKFLPIEYRSQRWLTGYSERLLANALDQGYELKWSHGLKPEVKKTS